MAFKLIVFGYVSSGLILLLALVSALFSSSLIRSFISANIKLDPKLEYYQEWLNKPVDIYFNFYLFNVTNPTEVANGGKPAFEQLGPFVYREYMIKENLVDNLNHTLSYTEIRRYEYVPEMSVSDPLKTSITTLNLGPIVVANKIKYEPAIAHEAVNLALKLTGENNLIITKTVEEMLFGFEDNFLKQLKKLVPNLVPTDEVGFFTNRNNTTFGVYTIYSGTDDSEKVGKVERFFNLDHVYNWSSPYANMINGTDGTLFAPFEEDNSLVYIFEADICRSLYATKNGTYNTLNDIKLLIFSLDDTLLANVTVNPDNEGFCTPLGNCLPSGVINITNCFQGLPIVMSLPHFLFGDEKFLQQIDGLSPRFEDHHTSIYLEPNTGIVMKAHKRVQFNTQLFRDSRIDLLHNVAEVMFPLFWIDENFEVNQKTADNFYYRVKLPLTGLSVLKYALVLIGLFLLALSGGYTYKYLKMKRNQPEPEEATAAEVDESSPLINNSQDDI